MTSKYKPVQSPDGWIYTDPLPTKEELKQFYEEKYYQNVSDFLSTYQESYSERELEHKSFEAELCLHTLKSNFSRNIQDSSVLELGSGEGFFLKELSKNIKKFKGVDFSNFGVKKFFPELLNHFDQADIYEHIKELNEKYDAIVLRNVIEHVPDPINLLKSLREKVTPEGLVAFSFPNDYSIIQKLSKKMGYTKRDFWFSPPDHLFYFNTDTVKIFAEKIELHILDMFAIFPVDLFLLTPNSNYVDKPEIGKFAHKARMEIELALWKKNKESTLNLFRQFAKCGIGREITAIAQFK